MKTYRLRYTATKVERRILVKLYKSAESLRKAYPDFLEDPMAVCSESWFVDGHHGLILSFCEDYCTLDLIAHECAHAATKLMSWRHRNWCQRRDYEEHHARVVGDLTLTVTRLLQSYLQDP